MILVNGHQTDRVAVADRGLQYGDGLFETLRVVQGKCHLWDAHMQRLAAGCERLGIAMPALDLLASERDLVAAAGAPVMKIILTRGAGGRGYRPDPESATTRILSSHPFPVYPADHWRRGIRLRQCHTRLGRNPALAGLKTLNRLEQVLARAEWDDPEFAEGLVLDTGDRVIECTQSNILWRQDDMLYTPATDECGIDGVMRDHLLASATRAGVGTAFRETRLDDIVNADEVMVCNSIIGLWPVRAVNEHMLPAPVLATELMHILEQQGMGVL